MTFLVELPEGNPFQDFLERRCDTVENTLAMLGHLIQLQAKYEGHKRRLDAQMDVVDTERISGFGASVRLTLELPKRSAPNDESRSFAERRPAELMDEAITSNDSLEAELRGLQADLEENIDLQTVVQMSLAWIKNNIGMLCERWASPEACLTFMRAWDSMPTPKPKDIFDEATSAFIALGHRWPKEFAQHPLTQLIETHTELQIAWIEGRRKFARVSAELLPEYRRLRAQLMPLGFIERYYPENPLEELKVRR